MFLSIIPKTRYAVPCSSSKNSSTIIPKQVEELEVLFGRRLRQLRKRKEWSQEVLAEKADMSKDQVSYLERGHATTFATLRKLAQALGTEVKDLFEFGE